MKKEIALKSAYSILRKETPLSFDCGSLCNGKCCEGDKETGMLLFPGEEKLIDSGMEIIETESGQLLAVCSGSCNRNKRPLACRIYPLFPLVEENEGKRSIKVVYDYRARCPIVDEKIRIRRSFKRAVRRAGEYLLSNDETADYLVELSDEFYDFFKIKEKFFVD